jgi:diguanylate cyclase (GGDEF)-like protein
MARQPRILAIDDTPANLIAVGEALGTEFEVQFATSGAMGLAQAMEFPPDLVLLDVMMPEMDGYETCRRLRANPATRDIPILILTTQNSPSDETRGLEAGAEDFITNPFNHSVLRARVRTHLTIKYQADLLRSMAFVDGLTGVANRRHLDETLESEWRGCLRSRSPLTLVMIDIDHFKQFNDTYGHLAGDACLKSIAVLMKAAMERPHDMIARYGGEEFICLLPDTDMAGAQLKAEELRHSVQTLSIPHDGSLVALVVTISIGVATTIPTADLTPDDLIAAADAQLYEAKRHGRNRIYATDLQKNMT